jgi:hypothetical protein
MLAGMPSDLSWRRATKASREQALVFAIAGRTGSTETTRSKRWICRIIGHPERLYPFPRSGASGDLYMLCRRCGRVRADDKSNETIAKTWIM